MAFLSRALPRQRAALFFIALAASLALSGCGAKPVAVVSGQPLTEKEFHSLCETATGTNPQQGTVGLQVLMQWIYNTLLAQEAKRLNVYPTQQDLDRRLVAIQKQFEYVGSSLEQQLRQQGKTLDSFKRDLLNEMIRQNVLFRGVTLTEEDLRKAFDSRKQERVIPERVRIRQITVESQAKAKQVINDLRGNAAFELVARTHSRDPFAQQGGLVPEPLPRKVQPGGPVAQQVVDAAFKLKEKDFSDPIKVGATWIIVRLEEKLAGKEPNFEDSKDLVRADLMEQRARETGKLQENQGSMMQVTQSAVGSLQINRPEYQFVADMIKQAVGPGQGAPGAPPAPGPPAEPGVGGPPGAPPPSPPPPTPGR
jgi:parvulin-like peptidyl-prolyl isomerase